MNAAERARLLFAERYDGAPELLVRAPGRLNLIGDHTDYNGGFVLPIAIDRDLVIAARRRPDRTVRLFSESEPEPAEFSLDGLTRGTGWVEYVKGVAAHLGAGSLTGWDGVIASDVAAGAGLSSSAAIELATARVFAELDGLVWDPTAMALVGQRAENEWVGMNSGLMDQLVCATARQGHARLIDCLAVTGSDVPLIPGTAVVLLDTGTRRTLVGSEYNQRRTTCEEAAGMLGLDLLRSATMSQVVSGELTDRHLMRARHVVGENTRTLEAAEALARGDAGTVGRLMNESHASLRDDFEVSSAALDAMARAAQAAPGCFGARQTGGGFAGSCVALVSAAELPEFVNTVTAAYAAESGNTGTAEVCRAVDGVEATWIE